MINSHFRIPVRRAPKRHVLAGVAFVVAVLAGSMAALHGIPMPPFALASNLPPTVTALSPESGPTFGGINPDTTTHQTVTITGTNFVVGASSVNFVSDTNSTPATVLTNPPQSTTSLTVIPPAHAFGTVDVEVTTAGGTSAVGVGDKYLYAGQGTYRSVRPTRICDTRSAANTWPACTTNGQKTPANSELPVNAISSGTVPASPTPYAVVLNVGVVDAAANGSLEVYPTGLAGPANPNGRYANYTYLTGVAFSSLVTTPINSSGQFSVWVGSQTNIYIDIEGYMLNNAATPEGLINPVTPTRICDTRTSSYASGTDCPTQKLATSPSMAVNILTNQFANGAGIPTSGVEAVVLDITVADQTANTRGTLTVWAHSDPSQPANVSQLNWDTTGPRANRVFAPVGADGKISIANSAGSVNVIVDIDAWISAASPATGDGALSNVNVLHRICDTRVNLGTGCSSHLLAGETRVIGVSSTGYIPSNPVPAAVDLNITVTNATSNGYLTVYSADLATAPGTSDLQYRTANMANLVAVVQPGAQGIKVTNNAAGTVDVIIDEEGFYTRLPSMPTNVAATAGNGQAVVTWNGSNFYGAYANKQYTVTPILGSTRLAPVTISGSGTSDPATSATVTGLRPQSTYTFEVVAGDSVGSSPAATSGGLSMGPPPNALLTPSSGAHYTNATLALDPTDARKVYAAATLVTGSGAPAGYRSSDGGATWTAAGALDLGLGQYSENPAAIFDGVGTLYEAYDRVDPQGNTSLFIVESTDKGVTWGSPVQIESSAAEPDRPNLAWADSAGTGLLLTWNDEPSASSQPAEFAYYNGSTWTSNLTVADSAGELTPVGSAGTAGGETYLAWDDTCGGRVNGSCQSPNGRIMVAKSLSHGTAGSWGAPVAAAATNLGAGVTLSNLGAAMPGCPTAVSAAPSLDIDRGAGAFADSIYVTWTDEPAGNSHTHVYLSRSRDGGATWSTPTQLDSGSSADAWGATVSVDASNGVVTVLWYSRPSSSGNYSVYYSESSDGGVSFLTPSLVLSSSSSGTAVGCNDTGMGPALRTVNGSSYSAWIDERNGQPELFMSVSHE